MYTAPTIFWRGECAYVNWRFDGVRNKVSLGKVTAKVAETVRAEKEVFLARDAKALSVEREFGIKVYSNAPTLREYVETDYLPAIEVGRRKPTARFALKPVLEKFGDRQLEHLRPIDFERYKTERLKVVKSATVAKEIRMAKSALNHAVKMEVIKASPIKHVSPPQVLAATAVRFFSTKELAKLYTVNDRNTWIWKFIVNTGLRKSEMVKARRADIHTTKSGTLLNVESIEAEDDDNTEQHERTTKSRRSRTIGLNAAALEALRHLGPDHLVPESITTTQGLDKAWEAVRAKAKLTGGLHKLRHTFGAHMTMGGVPIRTLQVLMGHARIETTEIYAHLAPGHAAAATKAISL